MKAGLEGWQVRTVDVIVLGAGMVGTSTALQLQRRGLDVALVDRRQPGEETSHGNAGIIERNGFLPPGFPGDAKFLLNIALGRWPGANYSLATVLRLLPWLMAFRRHGSRTGVQRLAHAMNALEAYAIGEHRVLAEAAEALKYYRQTGTIYVYRTEAGFEATAAERHYARIFGVDYHEMDELDLNELEPYLTAEGCRGIFWPESESVSNPGAVTKAFARSLAEKGGEILTGDARRLTRSHGGWAIATDKGPVRGRAVALCLGPWSMDILKGFGYRFPLAVKRGYHQHYKARAGAGLSRPVVDAEMGYVLAPMEKGIRLTTGIELAERDAAPTPVQVERAFRKAREIFPLTVPAEPGAWMGSRPCFPDSLPVLGAAPGESGLWLNFGHGHCGFTLGPVTGHILADLITGVPPVIDPAPLSPLRFL